MIHSDSHERQREAAPQARHVVVVDSLRSLMVAQQGFHGPVRVHADRVEELPRSRPGHGRHEPDAGELVEAALLVAQAQGRRRDANVGSHGNAVPLERDEADAHAVAVDDDGGVSGSE